MVSNSRVTSLDSQQHWFKWTHTHHLATDENTETSTQRSEGWSVDLKGVRTTSEQHRATENHPVSEGLGEEGRSEQSKHFKNPLFANPLDVVTWVSLQVICVSVWDAVLQHSPDSWRGRVCVCGLTNQMTVKCSNERNEKAQILSA